MLPLLRLDKVIMFRLEIRLYSWCGTLYACTDIGYLVPITMQKLKNKQKKKSKRALLTFSRSEEVVCQRKCDKTRKSQNEEGEELTL